MNPQKKVEKLFKEVIDEMTRNPEFASRIAGIFGDALPETNKRTSRRNPSLIDPYEYFSRGENHLRVALDQLDVEQIKDIIAEHGMDTARLAMKWKTKVRLIDFVVEAVSHRASKGDAFRG